MSSHEMTVDPGGDMSEGSTTPKVTFETGGDFLRDTRTEVDQYLSVGHARLRGAVGLYAKAPIAVGLIVLSWFVLVFAHPDELIVALCLGGLALGATLVAFCVQHDANHGSYFKSRRYNHLVGWTSDLLLGFSSYAWRVKHNVAHHTYTNVDGYDDDIAKSPLARFAPMPAGATVVPLSALLRVAVVLG